MEATALARMEQVKEVLARLRYFLVSSICANETFYLFFQDFFPPFSFMFLNKRAGTHDNFVLIKFIF